MDILKRTFLYIKTKPIYIATVIIGILLCVANIRYGYFQLSTRLCHELKEVGNWDSYLYYAVGHGMSEGLVPYKDMYENKPPLVFLLVSISYKIWGNYRLLNVLSFLSLLTILVVPVAFTVIKCIKHKTNSAFSVLLVALTFNCSTLLALFSQENSGQAQIETLATACGILSVFFSTLIKDEAKFYSPFVVLCGIFFGLCTMFKEPFSLICGTSLLLFTKNFRNILKTVVFPLIYAIITALLILFFSNCFVPYFTIYLKNMFSSHINIYGSPFKRMMNIKILFDYSYAFSKALPLIYLSTLVASTYYNAVQFYHRNFSLNLILKCVCGLKPFAFLYVTSFVVGLGGQYYNHHFIFATTFFVALIMNVVDFISRGKSKFISFDLSENMPEANNSAFLEDKNHYANVFLQKLIIYPLIVCFCIFSISTYKKMHNPTDVFKIIEIQSEEVKLKARYLDEVLSCLNEETYLWIGFNGYTPFAHTKHLPSGPCFAQDENNFQKENFFTEEFLKQLNETNVIIAPSLNFRLGIITSQVNDYVYANFTLSPPTSLYSANIEKPTCFNYVILYRKNAFTY